MDNLKKQICNGISEIFYLEVMWLKCRFYESLVVQSLSLVESGWWKVGGTEVIKIRELLK